ncbi:discoidin domain-containing protein [Actinoplanes sp. NPDC051859]|uniref:discoidin domain-containing protein n=1 Tax=Actinoplanes sp. NPDC051859 TaxID=3363909 RepID=UPI00378818A7
MLALSRRRLLMLAGVGGLSIPLAAVPAFAKTADPVAAVYRRVLLAHTRWVQAQDDTALGPMVVLGNAVLLGMPDYDAELAGVDAATLRAKTVAAVARHAATNKLGGGDEWGQRLSPDSTAVLYFVLAARLLWSDLDPATRERVQRIAEGQAAYAYQLNAGNDPLSGEWGPNGIDGGWQGDSKLGEMGVYAQALAPGMAWSADAATTKAWRARFRFWAGNASALPAADRANPAVVDGEQVDRLTSAHNVHDAFFVERDGVFDPDAQAELWRTAGRSAIHFLVAKRPIPEVLTRQPNGEQLWRTLRLLATASGEPLQPMGPKHLHRYARSVLPLAFLAQVQGDRDAARAEADLAERLLPWVQQAPANRLTKVDDQQKDEAEARAEIAVAYLLHMLRPLPVLPASRDEFFSRAAGTRDFGTAGLTVHQSTAALAAAVTKPEFARLLWLPDHDTELVDPRVSAFLPTGAVPTGHWTRAYTGSRDGIQATATVFALAGGYAGFATLPSGAVVYAQAGVSGEGGLVLGNTGTRTFTYAGGRAELRNELTGDITFTARPARYVRMLGREPATAEGYALWSFAVLDVTGADLAQGAMPTASSQDPWNPTRHATDGNPHTRWAVDPEERGRADSWLAVDLGTAVQVAGVRIAWDAAYGKKFLIQTSTDGQSWTDAATVPQTRSVARWVGIDGRAGLVAHGGDGKISVTGTSVGVTAPLVEGYPGGHSKLAGAAARIMPAADGLAVSDADGFLSVFNLTARPVRDAVVRLPSRHALYLGEQVLTQDGVEWKVSLDGGTARVEAPRFTVAGDPPKGTRFVVRDSHHVTVTAPAGRRVVVTLRRGDRADTVRVPAGKSRDVTISGGPLTPTADLARGRTTFPTSPLPAGMTSPNRAVDGDPATSWRPGAAGRMVVDLGAVTPVSAVRLRWSKGRRRPHQLEASTDGHTYETLGAQARYVAVVVEGWRPGDAEVTELSVT